MLNLALAAALAMLPPVVADPRGGPSTWEVVTVTGSPSGGEVEGYFLAYEGDASQAVLERIVGLAALGAPVVTLGREPPPQALLPYLDGVAIEPPPPPDQVARLRASLPGIPLVCAASGADAAVSLLAAGASAVLVADPPRWWRKALTDLLPEPRSARWAEIALATALRAEDLATVVGLAAGFPGGGVVLPGNWYGSIVLGDGTKLEPRRAGEVLVVEVPPLERGGLLIGLRPDGSEGTLEVLDVRAERLPSAAEVLARHHRAVARQERTLSAWMARQRLLVRVWVDELARSFEVVLAGPVLFERHRGTDWEVDEAYVEGVRWDPERLPDLPLLEPRKPPVPPLALRLSPDYRYQLSGTEGRQGRTCYVLSFTSVRESGGEVRRGTAYIDAETFGLVELQQRADGLPGEVRSSTVTTVYEPLRLGETLMWIPSRSIADDLLAVSGASTTVRRELSREAVVLNPEDLERARREAFARPYRMFRETPSGALPLIPDGSGGRRLGGVGDRAQRFLLGGVVHDPGLAFPVPFGGLQVHDYRFQGRDEQLRLLIAGAINDGAWTFRRGKHDLTWRAFIQLLPLASSISVGGWERPSEEVELRRQRLAAGFGSTLGRLHLTVDLGLERWDFGRTSQTDEEFVLPADAWESSIRLAGTWSVGAAVLTLGAEEGRRWGWREWGIGGGEVPERTWRRGRLAVVYEKSPFPLARLHLSGELLLGTRLDRFSAFTPGRFGNLRLRGIAGSRFAADGVAVARGAVALPLSLRLRGEVGLDLAWVREERSGYRARPFSGVGFGLSAPGPWRTLLELSVGYPLATAGPRGATVELFLLRPLRNR